MKKKRAKESLDLQAYGPMRIGNCNEELRALAGLQAQARKPNFFLKKKGGQLVCNIFLKKKTGEINNILSVNPNSEHHGGGRKIK